MENFFMNVSADDNISVADNFSCSSRDLSRTSVTELAWTLQAQDSGHVNGVKTIAAFQILYLLIGIPFNSLVIFVILYNKLFYKPTHLLLLNLAISDLLICTCVMPLNIIPGLAGGFYIGSSDFARCQVCHFVTLTIIVMIYVSLFIVALMSVDRLVYIKYPLQYQKIMTIKKMAVMVVIVWVFCILFVLPPIFGLGEIKFSQIVGSCTTIFNAETRVGPSVYYVVILVFIALFPFFTTVIANIWLLCLIRTTIHRRFTRRMTTTMSLPENGKPSMERSRSAKKIKSKYNKQQLNLAKVFGAIFVVNCITWIPTVVISFASGAVGSENLPPESFVFVFLAFLSQPALHPILEAFLVQKIRDGIQLFFCCCCIKCKKHKKAALFHNPSSTHFKEVNDVSVSVTSNTTMISSA